MLPMYFVQLILFFLSEGTEILDLLGLQTILLDPDCISDRMVEKCQIRIWYSKKIEIYTVRKEMKCSGETVILHGLVHDTTRKSESHKLIRV